MLELHGVFFHGLGTLDQVHELRVCLLAVVVGEPNTAHLFSESGPGIDLGATNSVAFQIQSIPP